MNTICPRCGKDNTLPFSDSAFHTHGFECEDCKKDFGVDDGETFKQYEKLLTEFSYKRKDLNGDTKQVVIQKEKETIYLIPSILYANKMLQPFEKVDISSFWPALKKLFFEQIYILDWEENSQGLGKEEYEIHMKFFLAMRKDISLKGKGKLPPYLIVLDQLFASFFQMEENHD